MDEIRCPMCGKLNPADAEICQFCQARLTPLMDASLPPEDESSFQEGAGDLSAAPGDRESMDEWLSFLRESDEMSESQSEAEDSSTDWLDEGQGSESDQDYWPETEPSEEDIPDWLKNIGSEEPSEAEPAGSAPASGDQPAEEQVEEEPDWLKRIRERHFEESKEQDEPEVGLGEELDAAPESEPEAEPTSEAPTPRQEAEIPDWMAGLVAGSVAAEEQLDVEADLEGLPDWLSDLEKSSALDQDEIIPFGEEGGELTFDWLQAQVRADQDFPVGELADIDTEAAEESVTGPFVGDLSDFLEDAELSSLDAEEVAEASPSEDLAPADLPNWLEAMRPVEAAAAGAYITDEEEALLESSGPLAGLQGVLPAEPEIAQMKKPVAYALRLQVSENQRAHADMFDSLVKSEGEPQAIPARPSLSSQYLFRLIIFLVLILTIAWPVFTGSQLVPLPGLQPEVFDTSRIVTDLPNNPLVLLAVDYEPGLAGELEAASSVVIDHLMLKGAYFAIVSTTPNGPPLAERLISGVSSRGGHSYQGIDQYANLGYLPGGVIGLQGFARAPQQVSTYALDPDSTNVWTRAPLERAQSLSDFDLLAVLSDDPMRAQAWIEQVQPVLAGTPMIALLSSQAEPLVRPYYQAYPKQVQYWLEGNQWIEVLDRPAEAWMPAVARAVAPLGIAC
ncbi:MAG: hypothetical protein ACWGO1_07520, partial [Anaerolineales bacterium]